MINKEIIEIIKSTAPVLETHGESITKVFYRLLFERNPELKDVFNMTNQRNGTQQKALAETVFKYATHVDKLEMMGDKVETIAQKHASLSVSKEAYPIVGMNLLAAIKEVLGDAATPEIMNAWAEAYEALAVIFINKEEGIYASKEQEEGGFRGTRDFVVTKKVIESSVITSFYLKRKDGTPVPHFKGGQYIALTIDIPNTSHKHTRNYSLSGASGQGYLRISVKREDGNPDGMVSNYLHGNVEVGDVLTLGMPSGEFVLAENQRPLVLISGGVGITPILSMYHEAVAKDRDITFIQCALNSDTQAFKKGIEALKNAKTTTATVYNEPLDKDVLGSDYDFKGFLSSYILNALKVDAASDFYFCGPTPFMANVLSILQELNVAETQIHYEFFGPAEALELVS